MVRSIEPLESSSVPRLEGAQMDHRCPEAHFSTAAIRKTLKLERIGTDDAESSRLDLSRFGLRRITTETNLDCFFLDCRYLNFKGKCPVGCDVEPGNQNYEACLARVDANGRIAFVEIPEGDFTRARSVSYKLSNKQKQWHLVPLDQFLDVLCELNRLEPQCEVNLRDAVRHALPDT